MPDTPDLSRFTKSKEAAMSTDPTWAITSDEMKSLDMPRLRALVADHDPASHQTFHVSAVKMAEIIAEARAEGVREGAARVAAVERLADEWGAAVEKPMPKRAESESATDQAIRLAVWDSTRRAERELRAALAESTDPEETR